MVTISQKNSNFGQNLLIFPSRYLVPLLEFFNGGWAQKLHSFKHNTGIGQMGRLTDRQNW